MKPRALVAALAVLTLAACATPPTVSTGNTATATSTSAAKKTAGVVGQPLSVMWSKGAGAVTVNEVKWVDKDEFSAAKNGAYLALDVTVEVMSGTGSYNPLLFTAKDTEGHEYHTGGMFEPSLMSGDLAAGEKSRGWIAFDVPRAATTVYLDDYLTEHIGSWPIPAP